MNPSFKLVVNGHDITPKVNNRLIELTLTDNRSDEADQLDVSLDDCDGKLAIPPRNATLELWLGLDNNLVHKGTFTLDEASHQGPPDQLVLSARSADFKGSLKTKHEQSWHNVTLADMLSTIAKRNGLNPAISDSLASVVIEHKDQPNQSDIDLLNELGNHYDAVANIKHGHLIFSPIGQGITPGGLLIPRVTLKREDGDQHSYTESDREHEYTGVQTQWNNKKYARLERYTAGTTGNVKVVRHTYRSEKEAKEAAEKKLRKIRRAAARCSLTLAIGQPKLFPETPVTCTGFKAEINEKNWIIERLVHSVSSKGYTTEVELELSE